MVKRIDRKNGVKPLVTQCTTNLRIPIVSLFCGSGGMDVGFRWEGFIPILAIDDNKAAIETYNWNDPRNIALKTDIRELSNRQIVELVNWCRGILGIWLTGPGARKLTKSTFPWDFQRLRS